LVARAARAASSWRAASRGRGLGRGGRREARGDVHDPALGQRGRDRVQHVDDVGRVLAGHAVRAALQQRERQLADAVAPAHALAGEVAEGLVRAPELRDLDGAVRLLPAGEVERAEVAVELDAALLAVV